MKTVYLFVADGFEEIEGLTVVDLLRRAGIACHIISITGKDQVSGSHGIQITADALFEATDFKNGDMLVLPGGMPGTNHLMAHAGLKELLASYQAAGKYLAAICAAPSVLGQNGLLTGKKATCYPGFEDKLTDAVPVTDSVVTDGTVITSRGLGTAIDFALAIVESLSDSDTAKQLAASIQYQK